MITPTNPVIPAEVREEDDASPKRDGRMGRFLMGEQKRLEEELGA